MRLQPVSSSVSTCRRGVRQKGPVRPHAQCVSTGGAWAGSVLLWLRVPPGLRAGSGLQRAAWRRGDPSGGSCRAADEGRSRRGLGGRSLGGRRWATQTSFGAWCASPRPGARAACLHGEGHREATASGGGVPRFPRAPPDVPVSRAAGRPWGPTWRRGRTGREGVGSADPALTPRARAEDAAGTGLGVGVEDVWTDLSTGGDSVKGRVRKPTPRWWRDR